MRTRCHSERSEESPDPSTRSEIPRTARDDNARKGFTLIEVLLVLAILAVATAVTTPYLVHSIRGNRLRTAARDVVMAGRYARSMAVVRQEELALTFDLDGARISVGDELVRPLDRITIEHVRFEGDEEPRTKGSCTAVYQSNGRCTPYELKLVSQDGDTMTITVDALSSARVEQERK
jgi:type II secretion system protein H